MKASRLWLAPLCSAMLACGGDPADAIRLAPSTLSLGLVAHWNFDESTGNAVADHSGNRRDGSLTGGTWLNDGRFGGALRLATGEQVTVAPFPDAASGFTVSAWVRLNEYSQTTIDDVNRWGTIVSTELGLIGGWEVVIERYEVTPGPNFAFWKGPNLGDFSGWTCFCMQLGTWTHVVGVVDQGTQTFWLYVDGKMAGTNATTQGILSGSQTLTMGQYPAGGRDLNGDIDDIAVWSRALVPSEIELLYEHAVPSQP